MPTPINPPVIPGPFLRTIETAQSPRPLRALGQYSAIGGPSGGSLPSIPGTILPDDAVPNFDLTRFVTFNGTKVFAYSVESLKIIDAPSGLHNYRQYLSIRNIDTVDTVLIDFGQDASLDSGIALLPGEVMAWDAVIPQDDIYIIGTGAGSVAVLYGNITIPGA